MAGSGPKVVRAASAHGPGPAAESAAFSVSGVISHASAPEWHGWSLKHEPERPIATVPRHRTVTEAQREAVDVRYADLTPAEISGQVTSPARTVIDCARSRSDRLAVRRAVAPSPA